MKNQNRVWIEFETNPPTAEEIKLMNKMLDRLGAGIYFIKNEENDLFVGYKTANTGYKKLLDNGDWFNLDYMGRDD